MLKPEELQVQTVLIKYNMEYLIKDVVILIQEYKLQKYYLSKQLRLAQWSVDHTDLYNLILSIFTITLTNDYVTYQTIVGMLCHKIKVQDLLDKVKIIADVVAICSHTDLIEIDRPGNTQKMQITAGYDLGTKIIKSDKHIISTHRPQPIETNWNEKVGSLLLGDPMNHHDGDICLDHLNRMNQIPFKLNKAFINAYPETPKHTPETPQAKDQWQQFEQESHDKYLKLMKNDSIFYLKNAADTRGRTYACGYHVNFQGSSFKKAIIQLANKEIVED